MQGIQLYGHLPPVQPSSSVIYFYFRDNMAFYKQEENGNLVPIRQYIEWHLAFFHFLSYNISSEGIDIFLI